MNEKELSRLGRMIPGAGLILLLSGVWLGFAAPPARAAERGMESKLQRGVANVALGWVEFFGGIRNEGPRGVVNGLIRTLRREIAGVIEVVTFPVGTPKDDYSPLIQPAWPLEAWAPADAD